VNVVCGGLHTIALTKEGQLYTWGRGEGGQLGLPQGFLEHVCVNEVSISYPVKLSSIIAQKCIVQVACGDVCLILLL
jgi:alpha-tubulin suppressor-like RCC1 family protein